MKIEIDFVLKNDPDGKLHDLIMRNFIDQHHWFENPYKDGIECDVDGIHINNGGAEIWPRIICGNCPTSSR